MNFRKKFLLGALLFVLLTPLFLFASEVNLQNGDLAREKGDIDIYILKKLSNGKKFKRLILNPAVFHSYGHLKPEDVKEVPEGTLDAYKTSQLIRAVDPAQGVDDPKVYKLIPEGDKGKKQWIKNMETFRQRGFDFDAIYRINAFERDIYQSKEPLDLAGTGNGSDSFSCGESLSYEGQSYDTVKIGDQCWMAENLRYQCENYEAAGDSAPDYWKGKVDACADAGSKEDGQSDVLYQWGAAMDWNGEGNPPEEGAQGICPNGWHIPTDGEWKVLEGRVDSTYAVGSDQWDATDWRGDDAGDRLKDKDSNWFAGNPDTVSGFSALSVDVRGYHGFLTNAGSKSAWSGWWTSSPGGDYGDAWHRVLKAAGSEIYRWGADYGEGYFVRCLKD